MRNIFVTRRSHPEVTEIEPEYIVDGLGRKFISNSPINNYSIQITDSLDLYHEYMKNADECGFDTEANGLVRNPTLLLVQFAFIDGTSFVIDRGSIKENILEPYKRKRFIGHNFQYDYRLAKLNYGVELRNCGDTMISAQIINRGSGRSNSLEAEHYRRLGIPLPEDKHTREDFLTMTPNSLFKTKHIVYGGYDPRAVLLINEAHKSIIKTYKLERRVYDIGWKLVPILGDMCINGFSIDKRKWTTILEENKNKKFEIECQLDEIVRNLAKGNKKLTGGIWTNIRKKQTVEQLDMFGESLVLQNDNIKNISYSSNKQLVKLFKSLQEPVPLKIDTKNRDFETSLPQTKESFDEGALEQYKIQYPSSRVTEFINLLLKYREVDKAINSFGEIFIKSKIKAGKGKSKKYKRGYFDEETQKVHTIYNQESTKNGRLSSGQVKYGFYNSQQMIKEAKYRNCFTLTKQEIEEGWLIDTKDLTSAELVILASNSKDKKLIEILKKQEDLHSYLCTKAYTRIFKYILNTMDENRAFDEIANLTKPNRLQNSLLKEVEPGIWEPYSQQELGKIHSDRINEIFNRKGEFIMDKKKHVDMRDPAKNAHYGINYGAGESKISETMNFAPFYGKLYMEGVDEAIPDAMRYLKESGRFGVKYGYIEFNDRTHSRHWFQYWLEAKERGRMLTGKERSAIDRACKNYRISGTQADMIKEAMVEIDLDRIERNIPFEWLLQVHDEVVFKYKDKEYSDISSKIITNTCNKYLNGIEMEISSHTGYCWHK